MVGKPRFNDEYHREMAKRQRERRAQKLAARILNEGNLQIDVRAASEETTEDGTIILHDAVMTGARLVLPKKKKEQEEAQKKK